MKLYGFAISHYCEKIIWAANYKKIPIEIINFLPGTHLLFLKGKVPNTHLPVLEVDGNYIQESSTIIDYLDGNFEGPKLTLNSYEQECREWELYFDKEIGPHLRRWVYLYYMTQTPHLVRQFWTAGKSFPKKMAYNFMFPLIMRVAMKEMNINKNTAAESLTHLLKCLDKLDSVITNKKFIVGNQFSRADLTAAALLSPLVQPKQRPLDWPDVWPNGIKPVLSELEKRPCFSWVRNIYKEFR